MPTRRPPESAGNRSELGRGRGRGARRQAGRASVNRSQRPRAASEGDRKALAMEEGGTHMCPGEST